MVKVSRVTLILQIQIRPVHLLTQKNFMGRRQTRFQGKHTAAIVGPRAIGQTVLGDRSNGSGGQTGHMTGQTGVTMQNSSSPTPYGSIPSSAAPSRTGEMVMHTGTHATSQ